MLGLIGLIWLSMSFATDSTCDTCSATTTLNPPTLYPWSIFVKDSGHIEATDKNNEYSADGGIVNSGTCGNGGECFDTHPNTWCPDNYSPYIVLSQYTGWGSGNEDLYFNYSVCIPERYNTIPPVQPIPGGTAYGSPSNYYQVSYYSKGGMYSNQWTGKGGGAYSHPNMSFTWTLYCYPMREPFYDLSFSGQPSCSVNNGEF